MDRDGQALADKVRDFVKANPYSIFVQRDGDRGTGHFFREIDPVDEALWRYDMAKLVGALLDNQRAALNYITYQLALQAVASDPTLKAKGLNPEAVEFPIFNDPTLFKKQNRIKQLPAQYFDALEAEQPYHGGNNGLWLLHELAHANRHRLVHPVGALLLGVPISVEANGQPITDVEVIYPPGPLQHGMEVVNFSVAGFPEDAQLKPRVPISIGINHPLCVDHDCITVINEINRDLHAVVDRLEAFF